MEIPSEALAHFAAVWGTKGQASKGPKNCLSNKPKVLFSRLTNKKKSIMTSIKAAKPN